MPTKSVVDIDVNDGSFNRFNELFNKYQASLAATPGKWKETNKEASVLVEQFERLGAALLAQGQIERENAEADKDRVNRLKHTETMWTSINKSSGSVAKNVLDIGAGLLKWGALLGGLDIGGSLFGFDRLAHDSADRRRSSKGLGLTVGEQSSFQTNFGRFVDPDSYLGNINEAVSDVSKQGVLRGIGVNPNQDTAKVALDTLKAVSALAKSVPQNMLGAQLLSGRGLNQLFSLEDLNRLRRTSSSEIDSQYAHYRTDVGALGQSDKTGEGYTNFINQLSRAGKQIETIFTNKLVTLAPALEHLSKSVVDAFARLAKSPIIDEGIAALSRWIDGFSGSIGSPAFLDKLGQFTDDMGFLAQTLHEMAHPIDSGAAYINYWAKQGVSWLEGKLHPEEAKQKEALQNYLYSQDIHNGFPAGFLEMFATVESSLNSSAINKDRRGNVYQGLFQSSAATDKDYGITNPFDPVNQTEGISKKLLHLIDKYRGDLDSIIAAYNSGEKTVDDLKRNAAKNGGNWMSGLPGETQDYFKKAHLQHGLTIRVENAPGANINTSMAVQSQPTGWN